MEEETKDFVKDIFSDPVREPYATTKIQNVKFTFDPATEFDRTTISEMDQYQSILRARTLYGITARAHALAKQIQLKSGINLVDINFAPGANKDEVELRYKFGNTGFLLNFPYHHRRHMAAIQAIFTKRQLAEEHKWYHALISGALLGRYQYQSEGGNNHSFVLEKQWDKFWLGLDSIFKVKYASKWLDENVKEACWTKQLKFLYDLNKESVLFKHVPEYRSPNYLYAKISHKSRNNAVDTDKCSGGLLRNALYPDSLWSFKVGHKNSYVASGKDLLLKSSAELGYNKTDSAFVKLRGYFRSYYDVLNKDLCVFNSSLLVEKVFPRGTMRLNDASLLKGVKGIHEFPGTKMYREQIVESGKEHVGDRIGNDFVAHWETKLYFPKLAPFSSGRTNWMIMAPYLYGSVAYAQPLGTKFAGDKVKDNIRGSTGFGLTMNLNPITVEFYYSVASLKPKCDLGKEFGFYIGID